MLEWCAQENYYNIQLKLAFIFIKTKVQNHHKVEKQVFQMINLQATKNFYIPVIKPSASRF